MTNQTFMSRVQNEVAKKVGSTDERFISGFEAIGPMTIQKQQGIVYDIGTISNWGTKWTLAGFEQIVDALTKAIIKKD